MQNIENTNSLFRYLIHENTTLKAEIQEFKKMSNPQNQNSLINEIKTNNTALREQILHVKAEILICRQIYQQQQKQRLQLIQQYSIRERLLHQKIIQLQQQLELFRKNIDKKKQSIPVKGSIELMNVNDEINIFMNLFIKMQQKYQKEKEKRRITIVKFQNSAEKKIQNKSDSESGEESSQQSDLQYEPNTTLTTMNLKKKNNKVPKLSLQKAKQIQKLIIEKIQSKDKKKKQDIESIKKQYEQLRDRYTEIIIHNFALNKRIDYYNRYICQLEQRNQRIIKLKADQVPIQAYQLSQRNKK